VARGAPLSDHLPRPTAVCLLALEGGINFCLVVVNHQNDKDTIFCCGQSKRHLRTEKKKKKNKKKKK
jgi:hypothetical protein